MARPKQVPSHNPNARREIGPEANLESKANTNAGPADLLLSFHSNNPQLAERLPVAYPSLARDADQGYKTLKESLSWKKCWFISKFPAKVRRFIYEQVFNGSTEYIKHDKVSGYECDDDDRVSGILEVCRTTRAEAMPIYHSRILLNIGSGEIPDFWFAGSIKINRFNLKSVQFMAWRPHRPADMVGQLLDRFPLMETLIIEAPPDDAHITINDTEGKYDDEPNQVPGFRGLLLSDLFQEALNSISIASSIPRGWRRDFRQAERALRRKEAAQSLQTPVKLRLATHVNIYSEMWLSWEGKPGETLKGLVLPTEKDVEPYMQAVSTASKIQSYRLT